MGDTAVPVAAPAKRGSYFARHWRGELSLPVSYWVNGVLLWGFFYDLVITVVATVALTFTASKPAVAWTIAVAYVALQLVVYIWALVGTWRSAGNYKGPAVWKVLARVAMVLGVLITVANMTRTFTTVEHATQTPQEIVVPQ